MMFFEFQEDAYECTGVVIDRVGDIWSLAKG